MASNSTKKKTSKAEEFITKYVIDSIAKNPMAFIPIIETMLDPENPDSMMLHDMIAESVREALVSSAEIKNLCLQRILENIQNCTDQEIFKIVNEQRVSLEEDSKEFIREIQRQTTVTLCEKYFETQRDKIDEIFQDYFKTISTSVQAHIEALDEKTKDLVIEKSGKNAVNIQVPDKFKDKVVEYIKFLDSQKS